MQPSFFDAPSDEMKEILGNKEKLSGRGSIQKRAGGSQTSKLSEVYDV